MNIFVIIVVLVVLIGLVFIVFTAKDSGTSLTSPALAKASTPFASTEEAASVVQQLEQLGYYKYAAPGDIPALKEDLITAMAKHGILSTVEVRVPPFTPLDYRYYGFDGETLFEEGGFTDKLEDMQPLFEKMGFDIKITAHVEECGLPNGYLDHSITINGKNYIIFEYFEGYGWGEAAQRFAEIINDQLELQQKDERLYLINGANDGTAIFLTEPQFNLLDAFLKDEQWRPLKVNDWCRIFKVDPDKYKGKHHV